MHTIRSCRALKGVLMVALGIALSNGSHALRVDASASVTPGVTITDNVCLSKNNTKWDWIGVATPSASVKVKGKKSSLSLSSSVQLNTLTDSQLDDNGCTSALGSREKFSPDLRLAASTVLIDNWLKLDVSGRVDQQEAAFGRAGGSDDFDRRGNRNNFYRYSVSPSLSHRIGSHVEANLRYSWDQKFNSADSVADTTRQTATLSFNRADISALSMGVTGRYSRLESEDRADGVRGRNSELASASTQMGYQISQRWQVNGSWGWDFNDYFSNRRSNNNQEGARWDLGVRWTPTPRTTVTLGSGNRYFGSTPRLSIDHKRRQSKFELDYSTSITYDREIRDFQRGFLDGFNGSSSLRGDSPIIDERVTVGYTYSGRNASMNLQGSWSEQEREEDGAVSVFKNVGLTFSPVLSSRYTMAATVSWDEDEPRDPLGAPVFFDGEDTAQTWRGILSFSRQLSNRFNLGINYTYTDRQSDRDGGEYQENRVTATLGIRF